MLGNILLQPIFMLPLQSGELVNSWCLVGCADSQGDKDKSPELCWENKEDWSLLENFDVVEVCVESTESFLDLFPTRYPVVLSFSYSLSSLSLLTFAAHIDSK